MQLFTPVALAKFDFDFWQFFNTVNTFWQYWPIWSPLPGKGRLFQYWVTVDKYKAVNSHSHGMTRLILLEENDSDFLSNFFAKDFMRNFWPVRVPMWRIQPETLVSNLCVQNISFETLTEETLPNFCRYSSLKATKTHNFC